MVAREMPQVRRHAEVMGVVCELPLQQSTSGGSGSFLVRADDGRRYWCKALNNPQSPRVPINEQIIGRLGALIGAAVCDVALVRIPSQVAGWEFRPGLHLEEGWVHGSVAVDPVIETRTLEHRSDDNNATRHASIYALHDWVGGQDCQWLVAVGEMYAYYSHDHGHYFPGGPDWTTDTLRANVGTAFPLGIPTGGLDRAELMRVAERVEGTSEEEVSSLLANIPADWPVSDDELHALLDYILDRRVGVAQRLRAIMPV
jgi:hypothetical protein